MIFLTFFYEGPLMFRCLEHSKNYEGYENQRLHLSFRFSINWHIWEETEELIPVQLGGWLDLAKI